jgi:hypothetical protein
MSNEAFATYVRDHLAGAVAAVNLLETLRDLHAGEPLGQFAAELLVEVEADRAALQELAKQAGASPNALKEAVGWLGEKVSRLKLGGRASGEFGTFEALEALALGILGKLALWRALAEVAAADARWRGVDFDRLADRAEAQHARVEARRLDAARMVLRTAQN